MKCGAVISSKTKFCTECGASRVVETSAEKQHAAAVPTFGYVKASTSPWKVRGRSVIWGVLIGGVLITLTATAVAIWNLSSKRMEVRQSVSAEEEQKRAEESMRKRLMQPQVDWVTANLDGHHWEDDDGERQDVSAQIDNPCSLSITVKYPREINVCKVNLTALPATGVVIGLPQDTLGFSDLKFDDADAIDCAFQNSPADPNPANHFHTFFVNFTGVEEERVFRNGFLKLIQDSCQVQPNLQHQMPTEAQSTSRPSSPVPQDSQPTKPTLQSYFDKRTYTAEYNSPTGGVDNTTENTTGNVDGCSVNVIQESNTHNETYDEELSNRQECTINFSALPDTGVKLV
jgi:hypothetical protein